MLPVDYRPGAMNYLSAPGHDPEQPEKFSCTRSIIGGDNLIFFVIHFG